jgi:hypothetical protein
MARRFTITLGGDMNYDTQEHEVADYYFQAHLERMSDPTEPDDGLFLLVDGTQVEEPVAFASVNGAVAYAEEIWGQPDEPAFCQNHWSVYKLKKVL